MQHVTRTRGKHTEARSVCSHIMISYKQLSTEDYDVVSIIIDLDSFILQINRCAHPQ